MAKTESNTLAIANFFIRKSLKENKAITQIKLQKLLYFAHGFHLVLKGSPLVSEQIEAWNYGPVIPMIYHKFKKWKNLPIEDVNIYRASNAIIKQEDIDFLDLVWHKFSHFTASQLVDLSHEKNGPWHFAVEKSKLLVGFIVPNIQMRNIDIHKYFKQRFLHQYNLPDSHSFSKT